MANGVFEMPRTPSAQVAKWEISQLSCGISQRNAPFWSDSEYSEFSEADHMTLQQKWLLP
jgi:hypothetical protein